MMETEFDLFNPPPSGPAATIPSPKSGTRAAYWVWRKTDDGVMVWRWILERVNAAFMAGEKRASPRTLVADCREALRVKVNDHFSAFVADELVERYPELKPIIERRKRRLA